MELVDMIPKLLQASIDGDTKMLEATALMIVKKIRKENPDVAKDISQILAGLGASHSNANARSMHFSSLPIDKESRYALVKIEEPFPIPDPILSPYTWSQISDFIKERELIPEFIEAGIIPPNSLLMSGQPGVGKTYIAHWISNKLNLPLVTLDLATSISSYLGRSGQNIRSIFDYAKEQPCVLFLDELDAIAKRRDDAGDLGELKRLVNVLLKEIENYPSSGVIIAATNHPELLDKAIWRRFDRTIEIPMPDSTERKKLLYRHLENYDKAIGENTIDYIVSHSQSINAADICKLCEHIKRQMILNPNKSPRIVALAELFKISDYDSKAQKEQICREIKREFPIMTQRDISQITSIPLSTVSRYLSKEKEGENNE